MNRNKLKTYAPQARRDFIQAVTDRATLYGLTAKKIEPMTEQGEVVLIAGTPFPKSVGVKRKKLEARIRKLGFEQTMEAMAYTWFNRLVAIRFMELHGYLEHGFRVLSHPEGHTQPEILEHAQHVDLPGLNQKKVVELKLDGTKEEELYRLLLIAQCNALHKALLFLFESINDEAELLLPDHLLHSDSLIRNLVNEIDEEDWQEVEIIGWLYQFYISEKKDEVIGKVVASENIPAATQLFTPNWIVKYLVQNTLGRHWIATYPNSPLKGQMKYYIEPAEQTPEVQEQLKANTPTSLNPEELTLLDPACGSGHILVEAYDLFKAIYQERGYRSKDIPSLILQRNLFGLEIDDRAAQLAAFALMMKARADDRRIFETDAKPNILSFQDGQNLKADEIYHALISPLKGEQLGETEPAVPEGHLFEPDDNLFTRAEAVKAAADHPLPIVNFDQDDIVALLQLFENAKAFGSLIQVPPSLSAKLPEIEERLKDVLKHGDLTHAAANVIRQLVGQALLLARQYDAVVANPPYMGSKYMIPILKELARKEFPEHKSDLYAMFLARGFRFCGSDGRMSMVTMQSWMFLSSFEDMRAGIIDARTIESMAHLGPKAFGAISGEVVNVTAFVVNTRHTQGYRPVFFRLVEGDEQEKQRLLQSRSNRYSHQTQDAFNDIPGRPIAYWTSDRVRSVFNNPHSLKDIAYPRQGMATTNNSLFLRQWFEVDHTRIGFGIGSEDEAELSSKKWFPYNKGGEYRKWYGNNCFVVNFQNRGKDICTYIDTNPDAKVGSNGRIINRDKYFQPSVTWGDITTSNFAARLCPKGFIFDVKGSSGFPEESLRLPVLGLLCSSLIQVFMKILNPTTTFQVGDLCRVPALLHVVKNHEIVQNAVDLAKQDWDSTETSWDFGTSPLLDTQCRMANLLESQRAWSTLCQSRLHTMVGLEQLNNELLLEAYGLSGEVQSTVSPDDITLTRSDATEDIKQLLSYSIGCMMGRYSLDRPGLIYAQSGNQGFDAGQYNTFPADEDGILPLTAFDWFADDAANRFEKFVGTAWPAESCEDNLKFVADSLGAKSGESPRETIRRYFSADFYKQHLSMYKKRPIYWLFSSGKQRGFQALVYLHRYNEGTLARMRTEYVLPLLGKMAARIDHLVDDIAAVTSSQHRKRLETEKATVAKQLAEVQAFDEKLRHSADKRIKLDLDDGVTVNYAKFGDLLAEVKAVIGSSES